MPDGLAYRELEWRDSRIHLLSIDLSKRSIRPVMGAEQFPILRVSPILKAVAQGALAAGVSGYNLTLWHGLGISDEPLHALVIDREIWTTGAFGAGGQGFLIGDGFAMTRQNRIRVTIWRHDHTSFEVFHVNRGHDGRVVAFTSRGGTNERPMDGRYYLVLADPEPWVEDGESMHRLMSVRATSMFTAPAILPDTVVLQARWPMKLQEGDEVRWTQHLGAAGVHTIVSGQTMILADGVNIVPNLHILAQAPHGPDGWYVRKNPRAALGVSHDGHMAFMVIVEGRIPTSKGLRLKELGEFLQHHGVWGAVNFDGGGSAFLWLRDHDPQLAAPGTYNTSRTLAGLRPDHYVCGVF